MPKTKRKILFLDFDGVLNHGAGPFHPECVRELNRITDMTGAEIVVHSSGVIAARWGSCGRS